MEGIILPVLSCCFIPLRISCACLLALARIYSDSSTVVADDLRYREKRPVYSMDDEFVLRSWQNALHGYSAEASRIFHYTAEYTYP
jgi:hypothetical protein